ncbi:radical SAM protein [Candidatus Woesearchaeota archaeon]|nr:radical SAM protein [Candidatus Woesearchaeota archaeon]
MPKKNFSLHEIKGLWSERAAEIKSGKSRDSLQFYLHIPFCRSKCKYCMYISKKVSSENEINEYVSGLVGQMKCFSSVFKGIKFKSLYIGGGTPSILSEKQIDVLLKNLFANFEFEKKGKKTFESNPDSLNQEKLRILEKYGINSISLGVQSLDKEVLESENRSYQDYEKIKKMVRLVKEYGIKHVGLDLIVGLKKDSANTVFESLKKLVELNPSSISLYPLQPTNQYLDNNFKGDVKFYYNQLNKKIKILSRLIKEKVKDYELHRPLLDNIRTASPWFLLSKKRHSFDFEYSFDNRMESSCFGIGRYSCSYIFNKVRYRTNELSAEGVILDEKSQKRYYLLCELACRQYIRFPEYKSLFKSEFLQDFRKEVKELEGINMARIEKNRMFFLPEKAQERFLYSLFFFDLSVIIKRYLQLKKQKHMPKSINIILGHSCNNNCIFCWDNNRDSKAKKNEEEVLFQVKKILEKKPEEIFFTGGEPTIYAKSLLKLIRFFADRKIQRIGVVTNGRRFSNKEFARATAKSGLNSAIVAVHGSEQTHDRITQVKGAYKETRRGIINLVREWVNVRINYVCIKDNLNDILPVIKEFHEIGVNKFNIQKFAPKGRGVLNAKKLCFSPSSFKKYLPGIISFAEDKKVPLHFEFFEPEYFEDYESYAPSLAEYINFLGEFNNLGNQDCFLDEKNRLCSLCFLKSVCGEIKNEQNKE